VVEGALESTRRCGRKAINVGAEISWNRRCRVDARAPSTAPSAIADASRRRSLRKVRRPKAAYAPSPAIAGAESETVQHFFAMFDNATFPLGVQAFVTRL
jgi:hypothetical protein